MELIGAANTKIINKNEVLYKWLFKKIADFTKSYRSPIFLNSFPCKDVSGCQIAIVPDTSQCTFKFLLFLYDYKGKGGHQMTFSPCLRSGHEEWRKINWPDVCLDLETSTEISELHLAHPILYNTDRYTFILRIKLNENTIITPSLSNTNISIEDSKEGKQAASIIVEGTHTFKQHLRKFRQDMISLYISGDMCDVEIHIGDDILHVHKLILCARSPVFKKMMEHDCLESTSNSITITDYPSPTFVKFLKYLYTGEFVGDTIETVMSLYSLGDKYEVLVLKETCSNMLQSKLSSESVEEVANVICDVLQLAECHGDPELKDLAASFIVSNFPVVSNKQGWKDLMKNNSELISNILVLVASGLHKQVYKTAN